MCPITREKMCMSILEQMTIEQMTEKLKNELLEKRFVHSIGVMECAVELARIYGADEEKAAIAGLLHDCAKNYSREKGQNRTGTKCPKGTKWNRH